MSGRALEIAVAGLGQAGGNIAAELARRGYRAMAFNTAATDLSTLAASGNSLPEEDRLYIGIGGQDGTGADVGYARRCILQNAAQIRERVAQHAAGADIVLITCGLGGGTGSAAAELVHVLADLSLPLMVLATLPSAHESGLVKVNAVRAVNELVKEPLLGWIFVDNNRLAENHGTVSLDRYYAEINRVAIEPIDALNQLNEREGIAPIRTLDGEDLRTLFLSSGLLNFGVKELTRISTDAVLEAVRECVQSSLIMPQGFAMESLSTVGLVLEAPEAILAQTPFTQFDQLSEQLKEETGGSAVRLGLYRSSHGDKATIRLVCASQQLPEGVRAMVAAARREGGQIRDKLQQTLGGLDLGEVADFELLRRPRAGEPAPSPVEAPVRAARPIATSAAERPVAAKSTRPAPAVEASSPATSAPASAPSVAERASSERAPAVVSASSAAAPSASAAAERSASAPSASTSGGVSGAPAAAAPAASTGTAERETSALAHLNTYDQLIRDYRAADSDAARQRVRERLEADRLSENSQVRYYVVRAMSRLDPGIFSDALKAAMYDSDASVRAIASKALKQRA